MKIAQISPLYESVPPKLYGGTERVVSYLTEELVRQGHDVTLFASGDSKTSARLVPIARGALRLDNTSDPIMQHYILLERVAQRAHEFDIIHFHIDYLHYPLSRRLGYPHVTTLHGRLDLPELRPLYDEYRDMPVVSISNAQRRPLPQARWEATIHHGLPPDLYHLQRERGTYLAFLGRISPEKRPDRAIEIAKRLEMSLKIAAKVDPVDRGYFEREIRALLDHPLVDFIGEISEGEKQEFIGNACALLFPVDWPEPFGLVMIEAMACGTPVVAFRCGSVPEIMLDGVSGFVVDDLESAVEATRAVERLDRQRCRQLFDERFTVQRMARDYLRLYQRVAARSWSGRAARAGESAAAPADRSSPLESVVA